MSTTPQTPTALDMPAGSEVFVIFARTAFDIGESVAVEWWPVGSTTDRAIAEAAVAGNRHARFETFPAHAQNLECENIAMRLALEAEDHAHELCALAQLMPGEGIDDGVNRIHAFLSALANTKVTNSGAEKL